ncbi:GNAT family N-acetyltransferase [Pseudaestuariivita atlantica]|uniref:Acetyltransferase n=1 Tax=Pseudaestuariivita atlantica TaxID=1317121 RepID=A0A0L1JKU1_9RHOB|nr:GNAT family N-acetyltransferase [Pseudaestuariivita atlantica]KNG92371.1 acetyltransferase [Pseudaestuariivita atlantica]
MSAQLHLARPEHLPQILSLVEAMHAETGIDSTAESREAGIAPLLDGGPLGAVYLIGPARAPLGYLVVTFGWSVEFGGMDCFLDEIFIRPAIRGRGIAFEAIGDLCRTLKEAGVRAMHLEVDGADDSAQRLYSRTRFQRRDRYVLMTRML